MKKTVLLSFFWLLFLSCNKQDVSDEPDALSSEELYMAVQNTIQFSGYYWNVKHAEQPTGPMNNYWDSDNVWVDEEGKLHLKIRRGTDGRWTCAEVSSVSSFGYGTYVWQVEGRVDQLDKNIVFGLFDYRDWQYDGYDEVDIEFARWGNDQWHNFNYTVYPEYPSGQSRVSYTNELSLNGSYTTYRFTRSNQYVAFSGFHGHTEASRNAFFQWQTPSGFDVPQVAMPVHMNLWLFDALAPSDTAEVELVIKSFEFRP
ncbi:hypothetical protein SAMN02927921_02777 [Sinomicrobium oceani]|uniref:GH16 domain-containing protein n=1 Tax=Sinomicrobium oceani TaxID=1150368 RepID=A0A1K1QRP9_9FLAO|nr:glycoside hydrolase family 16 protein [Sinomicrobium oceani]SFW62445.1 hypothetical protein SAMN02927921_02777 [Sinomicrobium oceani]